MNYLNVKIIFLKYRLVISRTLVSWPLALSVSGHFLPVTDCAARLSLDCRKIKLDFNINIFFADHWAFVSRGWGGETTLSTGGGSAVRATLQPNWKMTSKSKPAISSGDFWKIFYVFKTSFKILHMLFFFYFTFLIENVHFSRLLSYTNVHTHT